MDREGIQVGAEVQWFPQASGPQTKEGCRKVRVQKLALPGQAGYKQKRAAEKWTGKTCRWVQEFIGSPRPSWPQTKEGCRKQERGMERRDVVALRKVHVRHHFQHPRHAASLFLNFLQ